MAFENTNCDEYITEKVFHNAYFKGNIPIVLGTTKSIYKSLLPPNSFIHVDDFASPKDLAQYIMELNSNKTKYEELHAWRKHFSVENEHGYMGSPSFHYCRICEALNYNDPAPKVYYKEDLARILSKDNCQEVGKPQWTN